MRPRHEPGVQHLQEARWHQLLTSHASSNEEGCAYRPAAAVEPESPGRSCLVSVQEQTLKASDQLMCLRELSVKPGTLLVYRSPTLSSAPLFEVDAMEGWQVRGLTAPERKCPVCGLPSPSACRCHWLHA